MQFTNKTYTEDTIELDGNEFQACVFNHCRLIYRGGTSPSLVGCDFNAPEIIFEGSALMTLAFLGAMYKGGLAPLIENTFNMIRGNSK